MSKPYRYTVLLLFAALALPSQLQAHRLEVAAFAEGRRIEGSVYVPGGGTVAGARVSVRRPDGDVLAELLSDAEGRFTYLATEAADLLIRADAGDGHVAERAVRAAEMSGGMGGGADADLEAMVERVVARQLRPLREELTAQGERVGLRDVLGGIGYILGLAGLALWWRGRGGRGGS